MIRDVKSGDAQAIAAIYNDYILNGVETFETEPLSVPQMQKRIGEISAKFPYFVFETDGGEVLAYAYAHNWKERAAYALTLETSVYVARKSRGAGIGRKLTEKLVDECRKRGYRALIACITDGNQASIKLHEKLGFKKVSHFEKVGIKFGGELDVIDLELRL